MKRYNSGAEQRKKRKIVEDELNKQRNSLNTFLFREREEKIGVGIKESDSDEISGSSVNISQDLLLDGSEESNLLVNEEILQIHGVETSTDCNSSAEYLDPCCSKPAESTIEYSKDVAVWPDVITEQSREQFVAEKPENVGSLSTSNVQFKDRDRLYWRRISEENFYLEKSNGSREKREWLIYSETSGCVYCYICKLFSSKKTHKIYTCASM